MEKAPITRLHPSLHTSVGHRGQRRIVWWWNPPPTWPVRVLGFLLKLLSIHKSLNFLCTNHLYSLGKAINTYILRWKIAFVYKEQSIMKAINPFSQWDRNYFLTHNHKYLEFWSKKLAGLFILMWHDIKTIKFHNFQHHLSCYLIVSVYWKLRHWHIKT